MYTPKAYLETDASALIDGMRTWSFATLTTASQGEVHATHLPFLVPDPDELGDLCLVTHLARANPQLQDLRDGAPSLVIFQGPHGFISPSWYEDRVTFPTWNYIAIHVHGKPQVIDDADEIHDVLKQTVARYDTPLGGPWTLDSVPRERFLSRLSAIAAVRIAVTRIEGKMKLNQDKSDADKRGVIAALTRQGDAHSLELANWIGRYAGFTD